MPSCVCGHKFTEADIIQKSKGMGDFEKNKNDPQVMTYVVYRCPHCGKEEKFVKRR